MINKLIEAYESETWAEKLACYTESLSLDQLIHHYHFCDYALVDYGYSRKEIQNALTLIRAACRDEAVNRIGSELNQLQPPCPVHAGRKTLNE